MNNLYWNLKKQLEIEKENLNKLTDCKSFMRNNFEATQTEQDAIFDVMAQVIDRKENRINELKGKMLAAM